MPTTTDPNDPRLGHGTDSQPGPQNPVYLVLSDEERKKGFTRPLRHHYYHRGIPGPQYPLRPLTDEEKGWGTDYIGFEEYPESRRPCTGRYWTQAELDAVGKGCGALTIMAPEIAETYARNPGFYGATYCMGCHMHRPVNEFTWEDGTRVGS